VANRLDHLWNLSYEFEPSSRDAVWRDVEGFRRRLFAALGQRVAMASVIEEGGENGRLHVHLLVRGRIRHELVAQAWGHGLVWVQPPPKIRGMGGRARLRLGARYLTKYVGKEWKSGSTLNRKRYSTSRGFAPSRQSVPMRSYLDALRVLADTGARWSSVWSSSSVEDWPGPLVWCVHLE